METVKGRRGQTIETAEGMTFEGRETKGLVRFRCTKSNYGMVSGNHI